MRVFIELAYDGTHYHGWQRQPKDRTVQQEIEDAIAVLCCEHCNVVGCGRTDSGVHASYYVAHATLPDLALKRFESLDQLAFKLNGMLDHDIAINKISRVSDDAHARFDALKRSYIYRLHSVKSPFKNGLSARVFGDLDIDQMNSAAQLLQFKGEFDSFCKAGSDNKTTICDVSHVSVTAEEGGSVRIDISADRFLRNMVRAVVGTLLQVGRGKMTIEEFQAVIDAKDRSAAGKSAPACGLYLAAIEYPENTWKGEE